jgi:FkbM family methyltransferase
VTEPYEALLERTRSDEDWEARRTAVGSTTATATINVASNSGASSSLLGMLDAHRSAAPDIRYQGVETVPVARLDDLLPAHPGSEDVVLLKVDTQGYEQEVLEGGPEVLRRASVVSLEVCFVPLYERSVSALDLIESMVTRGFVIAGMDACFVHRSGQVMAADAVFLRSDVATV